MMGTSVKTERHDEQEINDLARKIIEQNRSKVGLAHQQQPPGYLAGQVPMQMARPGQPAIQNFMRGLQAPGQNNKPPLPQQPPPQQPPPPPPTDSSERKIDQESKKGRFGWCEFEKNYIPYIFRGNGDRFTSVRMVERKLLSRFLNVLPPEVNSCHCIRSYYITEAESKLLNDINLKHSDCAFGKDPFTTKDLVVRLRDAKEFYRFLDLCYKKLVLKKSNASDRCGFFRINGESVVPYTVRDSVKYVPLFYFEGETENLKLKSDQVEGWDLAYLKFCCKVQGIRNELFAADVCRVVALEEIKGHFPPGTTFEDYWPAKGSIEPVSSQRTPAGNWTQKPVTSQQQQQPLQQHLPSQHPAQLAQAHQQALGLNAAAAAAYSRHAYESSQLMAAAAAAAAVSQPYGQLLRQSLGMMALPPTTINSSSSTTNSSYPYANNLTHGPRPFPTKLTQIKEFPIERSSQPRPYKLQKALIDQKIVPCINVRPYVFHDLMMTLPDFIKYFFPDSDIEKARKVLQDELKVVLYKGNKGHQEILKEAGKCYPFDPAPLVLVKDVMNYMPQLKYIFSHDPAAKRMKLN